MIAIIDYGMGNLRSVQNAFRSLGADARLVTDAGALSDAEAIVLPGVGAFAEAMIRLRAGGFVDALDVEVRRDERPFLGLCLGMQLMAVESAEHGTHRGLEWIDGSVRALPVEVDGASVRVPHMGWNDVEVVRRDGILSALQPTPAFYFIHSYALHATEPAIVSAYATHGVRFAAVVERDNLFGTQFHPEKSQSAGLALLQGFLTRVGVRCSKSD